MPNEFWIVVILVTVTAVASIRVGYIFGYNKRNAELVDEIRAKFEKEFYEKFVEEFEKRVNAAIEVETQRVHDEFIQILEEEKKKNESTDSH